MRIVWAALAISPFVAVAVGLITGRVRARACCALPPQDDVRLSQSVDEDPR